MNTIRSSILLITLLITTYPIPALSKDWSTGEKAGVGLLITGATTTAALVCYCYNNPDAYNKHILTPVKELLYGKTAQAPLEQDNQKQDPMVSQHPSSSHTSPATPSPSITAYPQQTAPTATANQFGAAPTSSAAIPATPHVPVKQPSMLLTRTLPQPSATQRSSNIHPQPYNVRSYKLNNLFE